MKNRYTKTGFVMFQFHKRDYITFRSYLIFLAVNIRSWRHIHYLYSYKRFGISFQNILSDMVKYNLFQRSRMGILYQYRDKQRNLKLAYIHIISKTT